jgi:hypothetical protein
MVKKPHVFTTCLESFVPSVKYQITDASSRLLMIVKDRKVSYDDVVKAAKCAGLKVFLVRKTGGILNLVKTEFPIASSVVVFKPVVIAPTPTPVMVSVRTNKIIRASGDLLQIVKGPITKANLDKAAKCAGFKKYTAWKYQNGGPQSEVTSSSKFNHDVYLRQAIPAKSHKTGKSHVFNVCDTVTPKKTTTKVKKSKKELINTAIAALTELSKLL